MTKLLYAIAILSNVAQASLIKFLGTNSNFSLYDMIFVRALVFFIIITPFAIKQKFYLYINRKNILKNLIVSMLQIIGLYCWHAGIKGVPLNNAIIINYFVPIIIIILSSIILKEKIYKEIWIGSAVCMGCVFALYENNVGLKFNYYYLILFLDLFCYSLSTVFRKQLMLDKENSFSTIYFTYIMMIIISFALAPNALSHITSENINFIAITVVVYCMYSSFLFYGHYKSEISKLQYIRYLKIPFSIMLSYLLLHENTSAKQIIIAIIIVITSIYLSYKDSANNKIRN